jgi:CheY-like chemotaxis protein
MRQNITILIADRNSHVREFLSRELRSEGYGVQEAKDGRDVLKTILSDRHPDLLILDIDMPYVSGLTILEDLRKRESPLPVIIHTFLTEYEKHPAVQRAAGFWEKRGNNIDGFKLSVAEVLRKWYPQRFSSIGRSTSVAPVSQAGSREATEE